MTYKKLLYLTFLIVLSASCSNDFELVEQGEETPVVYGFLSPNDTSIYIRVEKTFIDENVEPAILAQDPANLYYDNVEVTLSNVRIPSQKYILQRVDGNKEGYPRKEGFFSNAPNYLYKLKTDQLAGGKLGDTTPYELVVRQADGKILAKSTTRALRLLADKDITSPSSSGSLAFDYTKDFNIAFRSDPFAHIHDIYLVIFYTEEKDGIPMDKSLRWPIVKNFNANQPNNLNIQFGIKGRSFYEYIKSNLIADPKITRFLKSGSLEITSGGLEIKNYINIVQANLGITSSGEVPSYTNIENGIGLFSSRTSVTRHNISFTNMTRDSVAKGIITKSLNFK